MTKKPNPSRHAPEEVAAYLAALPDDIRASLERVRSLIIAAAPDCTERVSYGIPIFRLQTDLVGISAQKHHCALHVMSSSLTAALAKTLPGLKVSGATVHFTPENPLPAEFIRRVVRERMQEMGAA